MEQRKNRPPVLETEFLHPERKFIVCLQYILSDMQPPPADLAGLQDYMRSVVGKEILRNDLEIGTELGRGEFGSVNEGHHQSCQHFS